MQKNEFEKQVQQKMEELKLHPSDSVWLNIEAHISRKKRRRLAWVFFPILFMCLCGGYWLMHPVTKLKSNRQNKLTEDIIKKNSPAEMQTSRQSEKDIAALNQTKKISNKSFVKRSEKKSLLKQDDNLKTVLTRKGQGISTTS